MTDPNATTAEPTVTVRFSRDGKLYYVDGLDYLRPRSWVAVEPDPADGKFTVLAFAFHEVKSGHEEQRAESDPLVVRYGHAERWPVRGSDLWVRGARDAREQSAKQIATAERSLAFYRGEVDRLDALLAKHAPSSGT